MNFLSAKQLRDKIKNRQVSSVEATNAVFERIAKFEPVVGAYISTFPKEAMQKASEVDKRIAAGEKLAALAEQVGSRDKLLKTMQSERDITKAKLAQVEKEFSDSVKQSEATIAQIKAQLDAATTKINQLIGGAMTFQPTIETWEEALRECKNDYVEARKQFPEQYAAFMIRARSKKERRT